MQFLGFEKKIFVVGFEYIVFSTKSARPSGAGCSGCVQLFGLFFR